MGHVNDRKPNFRAADGRFFLVRCFACGGEHGTENWAMAVASGQCAFCGWTEDPPATTAPPPRDTARGTRAAPAAIPAA